MLASIVSRAGRPTVLLQEQPSGKVLPLRQLRRHQPHSSPALSWNGRYLAVIVQRGPSSRLVVIEDRLSGRLHRLPLPQGQQPLRISLAPDARRLAVEVLRGGRQQVRMLDLAALLEPDLPGGRSVRGGGGVP